MQTPRFLTIEEVLEIHQDQIERYDGSAGVRDMGLLDSAVKAPAASFGGQFLLGSVFEMAAAYLFHLVKNHAFIDGNKRVGTAAALTFLHLNGFSIREDEPALSEMVLGVAKGDIDRAAIVAYFETRAEPVKDE